MERIRLVFKGKEFKAYEFMEGGTSPFKDFMDDLKKHKQAHKRMWWVLRRMANEGLVHNHEIFRALGDKLYEFKANEARLIWFYDEGKMVVCLNGFIKGEKLAKEKAKALSMMSRYHKAKKEGKLEVI